jgi:hypothetical protein
MSTKTLYDRVWETRKARINTEKRLLTYGIICDCLIPWISANLITINIIPKFSKYQNLNILSFSLSIIILVISIIISSRQFGVRASNMKSHYIELNKLLSKIKQSKNDYEYDSEYNTLLNQVENHSTMDYLKVMIEMKDKSETISTIPKPTKFDIIHYYFSKLIFYSLIVLLFIIPLIPYIFIFTNESF